ncbi:T9SS C-terminal target domain-containing protein [Fibrisoma montanum]|uniref:T9SS C-terminal target domain-containing protein n=1 Tax=Fibrisoma montanum TaxID=2305895 RepID=A0A418LXP1_9BACT|nr:T9SS type A sorting domain-containing protein [Fibrisoma montanum]RIV17980.1 T9SS C-terminal target domain-containing protein [Fibrisoma montanum]
MKNCTIYYLVLFLLLVSKGQGQSYRWGNVAVGGGGYTIGIKIHPKNSDLIYVRTDVGGMYRWDPAGQRLVQLFNWVTSEQDNLYGIVGIALHPTDQNLVYAGAGKYLGSTPHGVFKSTNQGATWVNLNLPVPNAFDVNNGNTDHRFGNPIEVNPHAPNQLWVGTVKDGLYVYDETTGQWSLVASIPTGSSVRNIVFDPKPNSSLVYVGIRDKGVYRSTDDGKTFSQIPGSEGFTIQDLDLSKSGNKLYVTTETQGILRLENPKKASQWITISPGGQTEFRGFAVSPHENDVLVTSPKNGIGLSTVYVSTNAGDTWTLTQKGTIDQVFPWHPASYPGSAISQFVFDPNPAYPNRVYFTDWYSVWRTDNVLAPTVDWTNQYGQGHEEVVNLSMAAPPNNGAGVVLYSGFADISGFRHSNLKAFPTQNIRTITPGAGGNLNDITGIDHSENNPSFVGLSSEDKHAPNTGAFAYSTDNGETFTLSDGYNPAWGYARVAVGTTSAAPGVPAVVAVSKGGGVRYSTDGGKTWAASTGTPGSTDMGITNSLFNSYVYPVAADRVTPNTFYIYVRSSGQVLRSTNAGGSFAPLTTWPVGGTSLINVEATPGVAGHVWGALGNSGLYWWNGTSSTRIPAVAEARLMSLGKPAPGSPYPTIYLYGRLTGDTERWIYRSIDQGSTWIRINNERNRIGDSPQVMKADRQVYGRVYIGTNGTGVWYGEAVNSGVEDSQAPSIPLNLTSPGKTDKTVDLIWSAATDNIGVIAYDIYQGTTFVGTSTTTSYQVGGLAGNTNYLFSVRARDEAGNTSEASQSLSVTTNPAPLKSIYEAEDGVFSGPVIAQSWTAYSGTGYLDYPSFIGAFNQWTITVPSTGMYTLEIRYTNGSGVNRPLSLQVNGTMVKSSVDFNGTGTWGNWQTVTETASLNGGDNTIRLTAIQATGPDIDYVKVTPVSGGRKGLATVSEGDIFSLFPNPVRDHVTIRYYSQNEQPVRVLISSSALVRVGNIEKVVKAGLNQFTVQLPSLPTGLYFVTLQTQAGEHWVKKLVVEK